MVTTYDMTSFSVIESKSCEQSNELSDGFAEIQPRLQTVNEEIQESKARELRFFGVVAAQAFRQ